MSVTNSNTQRVSLASKQLDPYPFILVVLLEDLLCVLGAAVGEEHDDAVTVGAVVAVCLGLVERHEVLERRLEAHVIVRHVLCRHLTHICFQHLRHSREAMMHTLYGIRIKPTRPNPLPPRYSLM